ncbi:MAG: hypothetical protein SFW08_06695 [Gemmatimonadaceae bacterium]|nr:hypothetical protein [Gemmatimonadaceae bacterium]
MRVVRGVKRTLATVLVAAAVVPVTSRTAAAQCPIVPATASATDPNRLLSDACNKANDVFQLMTPQIGAVLAGGNPSPSIGGTLGGFPHFNVGLRLNVVQGALPRIDQANPGLGFTGAQASLIPVDNVFIPMPQADAQIGIFKGFKLGLPIPFLGITNIGGIDALVSASFVPSAEALAGGNGIKVEGGQVAIGYGARLGVFEESLLAPGLSVSAMIRPTPEVAINAIRGGDTLGIRNTKFTTTSVRVTLSKTIPIIGLGLSGGAGIDKVEGETTLAVKVSPLAPLPTAPVRANYSSAAEMTRRNFFVAASLKILIVRLVGEVGLVRGGDNPVLRNEFRDGSEAVLPNATRRYATLTARIGL